MPDNRRSHRPGRPGGMPGMGAPVGQDQGTVKKLLVISEAIKLQFICYGFRSLLHRIRNCWSENTGHRHHGIINGIMGKIAHF